MEKVQTIRIKIEILGLILICMANLDILGLGGFQFRKSQVRRNLLASKSQECALKKNQHDILLNV
jgi:hypothetical protein